MKKIYTLALAALCTLGASAATKSQASGLTINKKASVVTESRVVPAAKKINKVVPKAAAIEDLEALNEWQYYGLLSGQSGYKSDEVEVTVDDADAGEIYFDLGGGIILDATYDAKTGEVSISKQFLGTDSDGDIYFYVKDIDENDNIVDGESATKTAAVGTFDGTTITFDELEVWAIGDPKNEEVGWYVLTAENSFTIGEPEPELIDLGEAEIVQNLVYKIFTGEDNTEVSKLKITTDGAGTYYLEDPLQALYAAKGWNAVSPTMTIDATDPNNVRIPFTTTGVGNGENPYLYFSESYYSDLMEEEVDEALIITKTVEGDKVTITFPVHSITIWLYNTQNFYYGAIVESTLTFTEENSGVDNVAVDGENAPIEYYNLLGNRVANPAKGQIIIKKQGSVVTKLIVK